MADVYADGCAAELLRDAIRRRPEMVEAYVELGFVLGRVEDYEGMLEAFKEAISIDLAAVRTAVQEESEDLESLRKVLRPEDFAPAPAQATPGTGIPVYIKESGALVNLAMEHIASGRDEEAAAALVSVLRTDTTYQFAMALLALTYLLMKAVGAAISAMADTEGMLREVEPQLAELLLES